MTNKKLDFDAMLNELEDRPPGEMARTLIRLAELWEVVATEVKAYISCWETLQQIEGYERNGQESLADAIQRLVDEFLSNYEQLKDYEWALSEIVQVKLEPRQNKIAIDMLGRYESKK